jgi:hypothetical protein
MYRTKWDDDYLPPSVYRINKAASAVGVDSRAVDAIRDMTALLAGSGEPLQAEELRARVREEARQRPLKRTLENKYMVPETGEIYAKAKDARERQEQVLFNYNLGMRDFMIQAAENPIVRGDSDMETAIYTFKAMKESLPEWNLEHRMSDSPEMQLFGAFGADSNMLSSMFGEMERRWSSLKSLDNWERSILLGSDVFRFDTGREISVSANDPNIEIEIAKVLNSNIQEALRISRKLRTLSNLNNPSVARWQADPSGPEVSYRLMKSIGEISHLRQSAYALHRVQPRLFKKKLLSREFRVRERGVNRDNQQLLYVLIDGSGSMNGPRTTMATGVLLNRLRSVVKGDAQLWYAMFDDNLRPEHEAFDAQGGFEAVKYVMDGRTYSGGGTNFNCAILGAVESIKRKMEANPNLVQPEILLITDGECSINVNFGDMCGIRLHTIMCAAGIQTHLKRLSAATKGVYVHLD